MKTTFDDLPAETRESLREKAATLCQAVARVMRGEPDEEAVCIELRELLPWIHTRHIEPMRDVGELMMIYHRRPIVALDRVVLMLIEDVNERLVN